MHKPAHQLVAACQPQGTSLEALVSAGSARVQTRLAVCWEDDEPQASAPVSRVVGGTPCTILAPLLGANKLVRLCSRMCQTLKEYDALIHSAEDHANVSLPLSWVDCSMALWVASCDLDSHVNDALDEAELGKVVL